jgi:uncharacterized membrane protein YfhO
LAYDPEKLTYESQSKRPVLAVFSENYYPFGWKAYVDGQETPIYKADYALRAIKIPAGKHRIEMRFEPQVIKRGATVNLIFIILFMLSVVIWIYSRWKNRTTSS